MAIVEVGFMVVIEERAVVDVDTLYFLQTTNHFLKWHFKLFGLGEEIWVATEHRLRMRWRQR